MFSKKIVILFVLFGGLTALLAMSYNTADAKVPNAHPPMCVVAVEPSKQYEVFCEDIGKDIATTNLYFKSGQEKYQLEWDETMMHLVVPLGGDTFAPPQFVWSVGDKAGSLIKGSYP